MDQIHPLSVILFSIFILSILYSTHRQYHLSIRLTPHRTASLADDAVCGLGDDYSITCGALKNTTLFPVDECKFGKDTYTFFAPDNNAWGFMGSSMTKLSNEEMERILQFHFYEGNEF
jgi:hypothetical protein